MGYVFWDLSEPKEHLASATGKASGCNAERETCPPPWTYEVLDLEGPSTAENHVGLRPASPHIQTSALLKSESGEDDVATILKKAADRGTDQNGDPPPSAQFLQDLAVSHPPPCIADLQKPDHSW